MSALSKIAADIAALDTTTQPCADDYRRMADGLRHAARRMDEQAAWAVIEQGDAA